MIKKIGGGVEEAAKILANMPVTERDRLLKGILEKDPVLAEEIKKHLVSLEDLVYLTPKMLQELLREISIDDLGLALRISSGELREFILNNVSKNNVKELNEILNGPPRDVSIIQEAEARILDVVRQKIDKGEIVLSSDNNYYV